MIRGMERRTVTYSRKISLLFSLFFVVLVSVAAFLYYYSSRDVSNYFLETLALKDARSIVMIMKKQEEHMASVAKDWGEWDESYRFVKGEDREYLSRYFAKSDSLGPLRLNAMLFFDSNGSFVGGGLRDDDDYRATYRLPKIYDPLKKIIATKQTGSYLVALNKKAPYLAAVVSIYPTIKKPSTEPSGTLAVVKRIDRSFFEGYGPKILSISVASLLPAKAHPLVDVNGLFSCRYGYEWRSDELKTTICCDATLGAPLSIVVASYPKSSLDVLYRKSIENFLVAMLAYAITLIVIYWLVVRKQLEKITALKKSVAAIPEHPEMVKNLPKFQEPDLQVLVDAISHTASELKEEKELLDRILENMPAGVLIYQPTVVYANKYAFDFFGIPMKRLQQMTPLDILTDDISPDEKKFYTQLVNLRMKGEGGQQTYEVAVNTDHGECLVYAVSNDIWYNGKPAGIITFVDITERWKAKRELELILELSPLVIYHIRKEKDKKSVIFVSKSIERMVGFSQQGVRQNPSWWHDHIHPHDLEQVLVNQQVLAGKKYLRHIYRLQKADGSYIWVDDHVYLIGEKNRDEIIGFWMPVTAIESARRMAVVLAKVGKLFKDIPQESKFDPKKYIEKVCHILIESELFKFVWAGRYERDKIVPLCSMGYGDMKGFKFESESDKDSFLSGPMKQVLENKISLIINADTKSNFMMQPWRETMLKRGLFSSASFLIKMPEGENIALDIYSEISGIFDKTMRSFLRTLAKDIGLWMAHQYATQRLAHLSYRDPLCGIPNINALMEYLKTSSLMRTIGVLNLRHFSQINLYYGYETGNELLCAVAKRVSEVIDKKDKAYRLGGDRFAIVIEGVTKEKAVEIFERVRDALISGVELSKHRLPVYVHIGVAAYPEDTSSAEHLLELGMNALNFKECRNGITLFEPWMLEISHRRAIVEKELESAIEKDRFEIFYQPIVDANSGMFVQCESLLRLRDEKGKFVNIELLISVAEENGLINDVTRIVVQKVLAQMKRWQDMGIKTRVAVNISAKDMLSREFFPMLEDLLLQNGLTGEVLAIEITERTAIENVEGARIFIEKAHKIGITVEIDDFGIANSSLYEITLIDFDLLKIDKSFVDHLVDSERSQKVVRYIINLAKDIGARTIAEGVETPGQEKWLREAGCDLIQGYLYARPMPPKDFEAWYNSYKERL